MQADTFDTLFGEKLARKGRALSPSDSSRYGMLCIDPPWGQNKHKGKYMPVLSEF